MSFGYIFIVRVKKNLNGGTDNENIQRRSLFREV
jgi:hypothetical protein